jgi:hypothetical protein
LVAETALVSIQAVRGRAADAAQQFKLRKRNRRAGLLCFGRNFIYPLQRSVDARV